MAQDTKDLQRKQQILVDFEAYKNGACQLAFGDEGDPLKPKFSVFVKTVATTSFPQYLRNLIAAKGMSDAEVYTRACITKNLFYRIASLDNIYHTSKDKVAALAIALRLNIYEAEEFYRAAGYNLTKAEIPDLLIRFCIAEKIYRIDDINYALLYYGYNPLGSGIQER